MNTIFQKGSKQLEYFPNKVERIDYQKNSKPHDIIKSDHVLKHGEELGQPYLKGVNVNLEVIGEGKDEKLTIVKYKAKKRYKVKKGYRARFTIVKMVGIEDKRRQGTPENSANKA